MLVIFFLVVLLVFVNLSANYKSFVYFTCEFINKWTLNLIMRENNKDSVYERMFNVFMNSVNLEVFVAANKFVCLFLFDF